ncbi:hypothetical protein MD484_g8197, partial [Candolleomyces efflorescens]
MALFSGSAWGVLCLGQLNSTSVFVHSKGAPANAAMNGLVAFVVQCFFSWRIHLFAKGRFKLFVPWVVAALALVQFAGSIAVAVKFAQAHSDVRLLSTARPAIAIHLSASLACDLLISIFMICVFVEYKGVTCVPRTQKLLNSLIINTIESGAITTACVALNLAFYIARPRDTIHVAL